MPADDEAVEESELNVNLDDGEEILLPQFQRESSTATDHPYAVSFCKGNLRYYGVKLRWDCLPIMQA